MPDFSVGRPGHTELAPHATAYVALVSGSHVVQVLAEQIGRTVAFARALGEAYASEFRYAPGKWTVKEQIGHLSDTERILSCRALRIARGDGTPLAGFEQDDYVRTAGANGRILTDLLDELQVVRAASLALFRSFDLAAWDRRGQVSDWHLSVRGLAFTIAGHELHHFRILQDRYTPGAAV